MTAWSTKFPKKSQWSSGLAWLIFKDLFYYIMIFLTYLCYTGIHTFWILDINTIIRLWLWENVDYK